MLMEQQKSFQSLKSVTSTIYIENRQRGIFFTNGITFSRCQMKHVFSYFLKIKSVATYFVCTLNIQSTVSSKTHALTALL